MVTLKLTLAECALLREVVDTYPFQGSLRSLDLHLDTLRAIRDKLSLPPESETETKDQP